MLKPSIYAAYLISEDWEPGECKCHCHYMAALVYVPPTAESLNEDFIGAGRCHITPCCDAVRAGGSRVEHLPGGYDLTEEETLSITNATQRAF